MENPETGRVSVIQTSRAADLPPKVLRAIFAALRDVHRCTETLGQGFQSAWIPATWVCRRWREVALATPKLWAWIDVNVRHCKPEMITTLIERCGDEDISVSLDGSALDLAAACAIVHPFGQRISHLCVLFEESQAPIVETLLQYLGPKLDILQIFCTAPAIEHDLTFDPKATPNIRTLSVRYIFLRVTSPLQGMKYLILESLWGVEGRQDAAEYMYELLAACPDLEGLELEDSMPGVHHLDSKVDRTVSFPKLRRLWINELAIDLPTHLANIVIPPDAGLSITARYDGCPPEWDDPGTVFPMEILPANKFENFPALANTTDLTLRLGTRCYLGDIWIQGGNWKITVPSLEDAESRKNRLPEFAAYVLDELPKVINATQIMYLDLHIAQHVPEYENWSQMLAQFPNVVALTIGGRHAFNEVVVALHNDGELLPKLEQMTACVAATKHAATKADARAFATWLNTLVTRGKMLQSLIVQVPDIPLNKTTLHLASSLVAYAAVRGVRVRVERDTCSTCHGKHTY